MKSDFSAYNRKHVISSLKDDFFDLVIVGGGITGAGVARDAASRGMKVALIEQNDFASGTSSRSSKLIHGGIRYLENFEFQLVFEALSERKLLFEIAPGYVHPLRFVLPVYKHSRVGMNKMGLGMMAYDALALFDAPELHERLDASETVERVPTINAKDLMGSFVYSDAYMDDDRLVHATLRSAANLGAQSANYVRAGELRYEAGRAQALKVTDLLSDESFEIRGKHFLSTTGPWTDRVGEKWKSEWKKVLRPTKGIHLTLSRKRFPIEDAVVMAVDAEDRIVFAIPRHEMVVVGTTDTDFQSDPGDVSVTPQDVEYLLKVTNEYFPSAKIVKEDLIASYAGVRPLVQDESETEGKTSREHTIMSDGNLTFVAGGKYTTYRLISEQTVDKVLEDFPLDQRVSFGRCDTKKPLLEGMSPDGLFRAENYASRWSQKSGLPEEDVNWLVGRYGLDTQGILNTAVTHPNLWQLEAVAAIHQSMCLGLRDFYCRRVPFFLAEEDHGLKHLDSVGEVFASELNWSGEKLDSEKQVVRDYIAQELSWK